MLIELLLGVFCLFFLFAHFFSEPILLTVIIGVATFILREVLGRFDYFQVEFDLRIYLVENAIEVAAAMDSSAHTERLKAQVLVAQLNQTFSAKFENLNEIREVTLLLVLPFVLSELIHDLLRIVCL